MIAAPGNGPTTTYRSQQAATTKPRGIAAPAAGYRLACIYGQHDRCPDDAGYGPCACRCHQHRHGHEEQHGMEQRA